MLVGATLVALTSLGFAELADLALDWNAQWTARHPLAAWIMLPLGLAALAWYTPRHAPFVAGSGIPQVIAAISLPYGPLKNRLVTFWGGGGMSLRHGAWVEDLVGVFPLF